jgi:hypothetical protein
MPRKGRKPSAWSGGITFKLLVLIFLILIIASSGIQSWLRSDRDSTITPTTPTPGFPRPTAVVFTDDEQFKVLKREDAMLQLGNLGREYFRSERHQGITGGFYSGIPIGASLYICYASMSQLADVVDLIDTRFQNNSWHRKDYPGWTIEELKERLQNNADVRALQLDYSKDTPIGTAYAGIMFYQVYQGPDIPCGSASATPSLQADQGTFSVELHYLSG